MFCFVFLADFMGKSNKVQIFQNGKWQPIETHANVKKIAIILIIIAIIGAALIYGAKLLKWNFAGKTQNSTEKNENQSSKFIAGIFGISDKFYLTDNFGNLYRFVDGALKMTDRKAVRLNEKEKIAVVESNGTDNLIGVNNTETGDLIKFLMINENGKVFEEKLFYKAQLMPKSFGSGLFITTDQHIIWRKTENKYETFTSPLKNELIADLRAINDDLIILGEKDSLYKLAKKNTEQNNEEWIRLVEGNSDAAKNGVEPSLLQISANRLVMISNDNSLEEYEINGNKAELKNFRPLKSVREKKPQFLANFKLINLETLKMPDAWCLTSKELTRCVGVEKSLKILRFDNKKIIFSLEENFWTLPLN